MNLKLKESLEGQSWTNITARRMFPILVAFAQQEQKITYGRLDQEIQRRYRAPHVMEIAYRTACGRLGDALQVAQVELGERIPPLNALVVNARDGIPGDGCDYYLEHYLHRNLGRTLSKRQREVMARETIEDVWHFPRWEALLRDFGLRPLGPSRQPRPKRTGKPPARGGWSNEPETAEHQTLKRWVASNPWILDSEIQFGSGRIEWTFASADRVDVLFDHPDGRIAVEVKSALATDRDLERGIYQCVKYQALVRAEMKAVGRVPNGRAILVSERLIPERLRDLMRLLGVEGAVVDRRTREVNRLRR